MRTRLVCFAIVLVTLPRMAVGQAPEPVSASSAAPLSTAVSEVEFGGRVNAISGDPARYQRLRDLRDGPTLDRLRFERGSDSWRFQAALDHAGYRDQRYTSTFTRFGSLKASIEWNQVPLFYSADTRTPFREESLGTLRLDDTVRGAIQSRTATTAAFVPLAGQTFELRSRRDVADARVVYSVTPRLDLKVSFASTGRTGTQPWGVSFGQANAVEVAAPVDHRTNEMNATAEWSTERALARVAYDGSWFSNAVDTLTVDNPLRLTDDPAAPSRGRMALWPDSTAHTVSAAGSVAFAGRSRAFGYVSLGNWLQDQALVDHTVNSTLPTIALARPTAEARAQIVSVVSRVTSRPSPRVWLNAQYRLYDYDNKTPVFPLTQYVRVDSGVSTSLTGGSEPFGSSGQFGDVDASFTPSRFLALRAGYGVERDHRTFRVLDQTVEHTLRASIDSTGLAWGTLRVQYDHAVRTGQGLDEEVFSDIGEQVSLRQFDISDRTRDRVTALVQVVPTSTLGFHATTSIGIDERPDAVFGLRSNDVRSVAAGIDLTPRETVVFGLTYGFDRYSTRQRSRQANPGPQFNDPTRDWATDVNEDVGTLTASADVPTLTARTGVRVAYDMVSSRARYRYELAPNSTLVTPVPLRPVTNDIHRATVDVRQALTPVVALGLGYAFDRYDVDDFALSPGTLDSPVFPTLLSLMYQWRPYRAHTGYVRLQMRF